MTPPPEGRVREVLVLGATGYVGGRLVSELLDAGHQVRVSTRSPGRAERYEWSDRVRLFTGDVLDAGTLASCVRRMRRGVLPRPLHRDRRRLRRDRSDRGAECRATPRTPLDCGRIVYLGGMGRGDALSTHLASRHQVGEILASGTHTDDRAPSSGDHRGGVDLVRDAALPHRGAPGDGHTPLGAHEVSADRDSRRPPLPRCGARRSRDDRSRARDRRSRCGHLRRDDADLRRGRGTPPPLHPAGALPQPEALVTVGRPGHAAPRLDRGPSHRFASPRGGDDRPPDRLARASSAARVPRVARARGATHSCRGDRHAVDRHRVHARPTPFPAIPIGPEARCSRTTRRSTPSRRPRRCTARSPGSAGSTGTTCRTGPGHFGGWSTSSLADQDYGAADAIRSTCGRATRSTSGAWSMPSRVCSSFSRPR